MRITTKAVRTADLNALPEPVRLARYALDASDAIVAETHNRDFAAEYDAARADSTPPTPHSI